MFLGASIEGEKRDGGVAYVAYSDGYDGGFDRAADSYARYMEQPATALAAYYHYFRGHADAVVRAAGKEDEVVRLPGLPPLRALRDLPSFLAVTDDDDPFACVLPEFRDLVDAIDHRGDGESARSSSSPATTYVLANTFDAMEPEALASLRPHVDVFTIGLVLSFLHDDAEERSLPPPPPCDLFEHHDGEMCYLDWLDSKPARSVVYISFGSSSVMSRKQVAEIADAMARIERPFLWVLRKDNCKNQEDDAAIRKLVAAAGGDSLGGLVVEWCDQARVLSHPSVACFVTHCGWNSTLEAASCGVPIVAAPQYSDQGTSAWLVQERLGTGVRAAGDGGVMEAGDFVRCVATATSEAVAARAAAWRERARAAVSDGGSSDRNLREFLKQIAAGGS
ncbi:hypothetical protein EJB05_33220, partial [Eragrostis curvula]